MDKRTITFVVLTFISLFLVNTFFDYQNQEAKKAQYIQQQARDRLRIKQLQEEIAERTAKPSELPLVEFYADEGKAAMLGVAVLDGSNLLTLAWSENLPSKVFAAKGTAVEPYSLVANPGKPGAPAVYTKNPGEPLNIGYLSDFGQHEMQLLTLFPPQSETPYALTVAVFVDGAFSVPAQELSTLLLRSGEENKKATVVPERDSIVLIKDSGAYLPVAVYKAADKSFHPLRHDSSLNTLVVKPKPKEAYAGKIKPPETYYVLENEYQQVVFSSYGGAIAEINLPFQSESNTKSVVQEIEFDRNMVEHHPYNARFPDHAYQLPGSAPEGPHIEVEEGKLGGYYPMIRRDLLEKAPRKSVKIAPQYYATNIVAEYPEVAEAVYEVKYFDKNKIVFESTQERRHITKTYTLDTDIAPYCINLTIQCEGDCRGLWLTSGIPEVELISGNASPSLKFRITRGEKSSVEQIDPPKDSIVVTTSEPDWLSNSNGFFGIIMDPLTAIDSGYRAQFVDGAVVPSRIVEIDQNYERYSPSNYPGYNLMLPLKARGGSMDFRLFAGPYSTPILKKVDAIYTNSETGYNPDYIACQTFHGWFSFISEPFAKFLFILMNFFHSITGSWAISIVLLTIALKVMTYPLNAWSTKAMVRTQELMPKVQALQQKYKGDPKKSQIEIMNLYKEHGVNPISGMTGGCFPLLIQMPFLIGMFDLLKSSFQLRGASFIPGWIDNLSSPDVLFSWSYPLPLIGTEFHLLPIFLGIIMFIQPRLMSPLPADKSQWTEQQRQQRAMSSIMAVMFTWLFYNFPSGLNIYWISSMLLGILQQWWNKRNIAPTTPVEIEVQGKKSSGQVKKGKTRA